MKPHENLNLPQAAWEAERMEAEKLHIELSADLDCESRAAELKALRIWFANFNTRAAAEKVPVPWAARGIE